MNFSDLITKYKRAVLGKEYMAYSHEVDPNYIDSVFDSSLDDTQNRMRSQIKKTIDGSSKDIKKKMKDFLDMMKTKEFFKPGTLQSFDKIKELTDKWIVQARKENLISKNITAFKRVDLKFIQNQYSEVEKPWMLREIAQGGNLEVTSYQNKHSTMDDDLYRHVNSYVESASRNETEGTVFIEGEVLTLGGMILGIHGSVVVVYFGFIHELMMNDIIDKQETMSSQYGTLSASHMSTASVYHQNWTPTVSGGMHVNNALKNIKKISI